MFNKAIQLISQTYAKDDIGQQIPSIEYKKVFASEKSIGQNEFFLAGQSRIKPEKCFIVRQIDYNGEAKIRYPADNEGTVYSIYRTFPAKNEMIELYCEVRAGSG